MTHPADVFFSNIILITLLFFLFKKIIKSRHFKQILKGAFSQTTIKREPTQTIMENPSTFYEKKSSCMNSNESRIFYYLNHALDELLPNKKERSNFYIFPQVSLHAFISLLEPKSSTKDELEAARKIFLNKNIDFLICQSCRRYFSLPGETHATRYYYEYRPVLMIEIDGSSHYSLRYGKKNFYQQQRSDEFKDILSRELNIPLLRYKLTDDKVHGYDYNNLIQALKEYLS